MKKILLITYFVIISLAGKAQTDCNKEFVGDDVYRWRNEGFLSHFILYTLF